MNTTQENIGSYYIHTFGCQMNVHDSDRMEEILKKYGFYSTSKVEEASVIVFNTCSVREKAEQKLRSEVGKLATLKEKKPDLMIVVAGCVAQQEGEALLQDLPIDVVIGPDNIIELPRLIEEQKAGGLPIARTEFDLKAPYFLTAQPEKGHAPVTAFVTTMKGCDERCSYCIVPYTRGKERYRPSWQIIEEIKRWVDAGAKEITLLGQTVDSYRDPALPPLQSEDPDESQFPLLLELIAKRVPQLIRLRYISPHPRHLTPSLIRAHAEIPILAKHVHMPVQSGSNRILKRMIRRYTREEYIERVMQLKKVYPGFTLSTDVIVGFPGETEQDFQDTLSLVEEVGFVSLFGFMYSERPYTPSKKLIDDVPSSQKKERLARLFSLVDKNNMKHLSSLVGTTQKVLVEGLSKTSLKQQEPGLLKQYQGRTEQNEIVNLLSEEGYSLTANVIEAKIIKANKYSLIGEITPSAKNLLRVHGKLESVLTKKERYAFTVLR